MRHDYETEFPKFYPYTTKELDLKFLESVDEEYILKVTDLDLAKGLKNNLRYNPEGVSLTFLENPFVRMSVKLKMVEYYNKINKLDMNSTSLYTDAMDITFDGYNIFDLLNKLSEAIKRISIDEQWGNEADNADEEYFLSNVGYSERESFYIFIYSFNIYLKFSLVNMINTDKLDNFNICMIPNIRDIYNGYLDIYFAALDTLILYTSFIPNSGYNEFDYRTALNCLKS